MLVYCYLCDKYHSEGLFTHGNYLCRKCFSKWIKYMDINNPDVYELDLYGGNEELFEKFISSVRMLEELIK